MSKRSQSDYDLYGDVEKIKDALIDVSKDIKGRASEAISQSVDGLKDKSDEVRDKVVDYTTDQPLKSLGIALLAGFAIGFFIRK